MKKTFFFPFPLVIFAILLAVSDRAFAQQRPRGRDLGIPFSGTPGPLNAITDVKGGRLVK